jgi:hypothetical protein
MPCWGLRGDFDVALSSATIATIILLFKKGEGGIVQALTKSLEHGAGKSNLKEAEESGERMSCYAS